MTLYLDTSALLKLYVDERGTIETRQAVEAGEAIATARVAYPEACAAFARARREGRLTQAQLEACVRDLDRDFPGLDVVELTEPVARAAGRLAEAHALRGFDAVHLASALELRARLGSPVVVLCFDDRLAAAARAEHLAR